MLLQCRAQIRDDAREFSVVGFDRPCAQFANAFFQAGGGHNTGCYRLSPLPIQHLMYSRSERLYHESAIDARRATFCRFAKMRGQVELLHVERIRAAAQKTVAAKRPAGSNRTSAATWLLEIECPKSRQTAFGIRNSCRG
jgi:hypothetical protein